MGTRWDGACTYIVIEMAIILLGQSGRLAVTVGHRIFISCFVLHIEAFH